MREFFELTDAGRLDEAAALLHGEVVTFPLYRVERPVLRGPQPLMDRMAALKKTGVWFRLDDYTDLGDGLVLACGEVGSPEDREDSFMLCRVDDGLIVTIESHPTEEAALTTAGRIEPPPG